MLSSTQICKWVRLNPGKVTGLCRGPFSRNITNWFVRSIIYEKDMGITGGSEKCLHHSFLPIFRQNIFKKRTCNYYGTLNLHCFIHADISRDFDEINPSFFNWFLVLLSVCCCLIIESFEGISNLYPREKVLKQRRI